MSILISLVRSLWRQYFLTVNAIVFIIDAVDKERIKEAKKELDGVLIDPKIKDLVN